MASENAKREPTPEKPGLVRCPRCNGLRVKLEWWVGDQVYIVGCRDCIEQPGRDECVRRHKRAASNDVGSTQEREPSVAARLSMMETIPIYGEPIYAGDDGEQLLKVGDHMFVSIATANAHNEAVAAYEAACRAENPTAGRQQSEPLGGRVSDDVFGGNIQHHMG